MPMALADPAGARSTACCWTWASVRCQLDDPDQGLQLPRRRAAGPALRPGLGAARRRPGGATWTRRELADLSGAGARNGQPADRPGLVRPGAEEPVGTTGRLPDDRRRGPAAGRQAHADPQPGLPGPAHRRQRGTGGPGGGPGSCRTCWSRAAASRSSPTTRWRTAWSSGSSTGRGGTASARPNCPSAAAATCAP